MSLILVWLWWVGAGTPSVERLSSRLEDEGSSLSELDMTSLSLSEPSSSSDDSSREGIDSSESESAEVWEDALLEDEAIRVGELDSIVPARVSASLAWWRLNAWRLVRLSLFERLGSRMVGWMSRSE